MSTVSKLHRHFKQGKKRDPIPLPVALPATYVPPIHRRYRSLADLMRNGYDFTPEALASRSY